VPAELELGEQVELVADVRARTAGGTEAVGAEVRLRGIQSIAGLV